MSSPNRLLNRASSHGLASQRLRGGIASFIAALAAAGWGGPITFANPQDSGHPSVLDRSVQEVSDDRPGVTEIIVDDLDPWEAGGFCIGGSCPEVGFQRSGPEQFWWRNTRSSDVVWEGRALWTGGVMDLDDSTNWATWATTLEEPGEWEVLAFIPSMATGRGHARAAVYCIEGVAGFPRAESRAAASPSTVVCDGVDVTVDQATNAGRWVSLGTYPFVEDPWYVYSRVTLSDWVGDSTLPVSVLFDAIKWRRWDDGSSEPVEIDAFLLNNPDGVAVAEGSRIEYCFQLSGSAWVELYWYNPHSGGWSSQPVWTGNVSDSNPKCAVSDPLRGVGIRRVRADALSARGGVVLSSAETYFFVGSGVPATPTFVPPPPSPPPPPPPPTVIPTPRDCPILSGTIRTADGSVVGQATVIVDGGSERREVLSDPQGRFEISGLRGGTYRLRVLRKGYKYLIRDINLPANQCTSRDAIIEVEGWLDWPLKEKAGRISTYFDHQFPTLYEGCVSCPPYRLSLSAQNDVAGSVVPFFSSKPLPTGGQTGDPWDPGTHIEGSGHNGIDVYGVKDRPIYAPGDGVAISGYHETGYGNFVDIHHDNGCNTRMAHLASILVDDGADVQRGQTVIGTVGGTGGFDDHPHLHFEVRCDGVPVDPFGWQPTSVDPWQRLGAPASEWVFRSATAGNIDRDRVVASGLAAASLMSVAGDLAIDVPAGAFGQDSVLLTMTRFPDGSGIGIGSHSTLTLASFTLQAVDDTGAEVPRATRPLQITVPLAPLAHDSEFTPGSAGIYRWDSDAEQWVLLSGGGAQSVLRAETSELGWYRVMADAATRVFLPLAVLTASID